jgi:hypothetical protein
VFILKEVTFTILAFFDSFGGFYELLGDKIPNQNKKPGSAAAAG